MPTVSPTISPIISEAAQKFIRQQHAQSQPPVAVEALVLPDIGEHNAVLQSLLQIPQFRHIFTLHAAAQPQPDFQLWANFPRVQDIFAVGPGEQAPNETQRYVISQENSKLASPILDGEFTKERLYDFTNAWIAYRGNNGQKPLVMAISKSIQEIIEIKSESPVGLVATLRGTDEILLWQLLHDYFRAADISGAEAMLRDFAKASQPTLQLGDLQALRNYKDSFEFQLRCLGENMLPSHPVICSIYISALPKYLQTALHHHAPTFFLDAHRHALSATLDRQKIHAASTGIPSLQRHLYSSGGLPGGSSAPYRFCNHCKRTNHDTDHCWQLYPQQRPARLSSPPRDSAAVAASTPASSSVAPIRPSPTPQRQPRNSAIPSSPSLEHVSSSTPTAPRQTPARAPQGPANATVPTATTAPTPTATRRITRSMDTNAGGATTSSARPASMRTQTARRLEICPEEISDYLDQHYSIPTLDFPESLPSSAYRAQHAQSAMSTPWPRGTTIPDPVSVQSVDAWAGPTITAEQAQLMAQGFLPNPDLDDDDDEDDDDDYSMSDPEETQSSRDPHSVTEDDLEDA